MDMIKIFIDGEHGTTGLQIRNRLEKRSDIEILSLKLADRHDIGLRRECMNAADIAILCLPDQAAKETVNFHKHQKNLRIIDSSTAYRVDPRWVYGFPEMHVTQREKIRNACFVSNPGCYATGAISLLRPLREANALSENAYVTLYVVSGYTGGGKQLIHLMEDKTEKDAPHYMFFSYSLEFKHKHLPEIKTYGQLKHIPIFMPNVARFRQGMLVNLSLRLKDFVKTLDPEMVFDIFQNYYAGENNIIVATLEEAENIERLNPEELAGSDQLKIYIFCNREEGIISLYASLDNLGKGASGAAIQNLDIMLS